MFREVIQSMKTRQIKLIATISLTIFLGWFIGLLLAFYLDLPPLADLENYKPSLASKIYDEKGTLIAQLFIEQRSLVPLKKYPSS